MVHFKAQGITFTSLDFEVHASHVKLEIDLDSNEVHGAKVSNESIDLYYSNIKVTEDGNSVDFDNLEDWERSQIENDLITEMQNI